MSENSDDYGSIEVAQCWMTVPHDQLHKEVDSDLVQTASESEIEDDVDPHASKKRP